MLVRIDRNYCGHLCGSRRKQTKLKAAISRGVLKIGLCFRLALSKLGEMGNTALTCFRGKGGRVKVVLMNGETAEFKGFVTASTVMRKYPHHLVLQCSLVGGRGPGQRRKIAVLKPEQPLKVSQNYLIVPVQTASSNSRSFLDSWAFFSLNSCSSFHSRASAAFRKKSQQRPPRWSIKSMFARFFRYSTVDDREAYKRLLDSEENYDSSAPLIQQPSSRPSLDGAPKDWRPSLECIPESPLFSPHLSRNSSSPTRPDLLY